MTDTVRVPREPTQAMLDAFLRCIPTDYAPDRHEKRAAYAAMLAASPQGEGDCVCVQRGDGPEGCGLCNETGVATPPAEPQWITHDGGPNPVPGKMVDWRNREGREETCGSDELAGWEHPHESGARYDIIAYRVTEGVKP